MGPSSLVGVSCHSLEDAKKAAEEGADYLTISPVFRSVSKPEYGTPIGLDGLRHVADNVSIPVIALGGITPNNLTDCLTAGAAGVAVLGTLMGSEDPRMTAAAFVKAANGVAAR